MIQRCQVLATKGLVEFLKQKLSTKKNLNILISYLHVHILNSNYDTEKK